MSQLRQATISDASELAELFLAARQYSIHVIPPIVGDATRVFPWIESKLSASDDCWVMQDEAGISAMLFLEPGWIDQLYVRPDAIGLGLGSLLVEKAKALMPAGIQLWTFQSNLGAQKFYERHGFVAMEWTDGANNEERSPDVRYVWSGIGG
jgi:GNAT superfamily N-acetyltransferase